MRTCDTRSVWAWLLVGLVSSAAAQDGGSTVEVGVGYNTQDNYRFRLYNGLPDAGGFGVGAFAWRGPLAGSQGGELRLEGQELGLETARLFGAWSMPGRYRFSLRLDRIPQREFDDAQTPFLGAGGPRQRLPQGWVGGSTTQTLTALNTTLQDIDTDKRRQRWTSTLGWTLSEHWSVDAELRHETKRGSDAFGAIFGSTGGNPRGAILERPVDFITDDLTVSARYAKARSQLGLAYTVLRFRNAADRLQWDNPFNNPQWLAGTGFSAGAVGELALEPDNLSHQWTLSGTHAFSARTRLTGTLSRARLTQDQGFLPYSAVVSTSTPLPRQDLRGQVETLQGNLTLSTRLFSRTTLRGHYQYRDRDNQTPQDLFLRVAGDVAAQATPLSDGARVNRIYDLTTRRYGAELEHRLSSPLRLSLGYTVEAKDFTMLDAERTSEDIGFVRLTVRPATTVSGWLRYTRSQRDPSGYDVTRPFVTGHNPDFVATLTGDALFENDPLLRRFHLAARDRDEWAVSTTWMPTPAVSVSLVGRLAEDDYPESVVGLRASRKTSLAADVTYAPVPEWQVGVFVNADDYDNQQLGYARQGGAAPTPILPVSARLASRTWQVDSVDQVRGGGLRGQWSGLGGRLTLESEAAITLADTDTGPGSPGLAWSPLPSVTTDILQLSARVSYALAGGREVRLRWFYEDFTSTDFGLDGVAPDTLSNVILLGNQSPSYDGHRIELSMVFRLRDR